MTWKYPGLTLPTVINVLPSGDVTGSIDTNAIQQAINRCVANGGGEVLLSSGVFYVNAQIKVYPNVTFIGQGNGYDQAGAFYGTLIYSSYNGSTILAQQDSRNSSFIRLSNFGLFGKTALTSQNGIEFSTAGGGQVPDSILENLVIINIGQHGLYLNANASKIQAINCWLEFCTAAAIKDVRNNTGTLALVNCIVRNCVNFYDGSSAGFVFIDITNPNVDTLTGVGIKIPPSFSTFNLQGGFFHSCAGGGVSLAADSGQINIETEFKSNGTNAIAQIFGSPGTNSSTQIQIRSRFWDTRTGGTNVTNHILLAASGVSNVVVAGSTFYGSQSDAVAWTSRSGNKIIIKSCLGYNDVKGSITNMISAANRIGAAGTTTTAVASTDYIVEGTDLYLNITGGTGVSITTKDPQGNTIQSGLSTFTGILPVGYQINFGAFSGAPTIFASVV